MWVHECRSLPPTDVTTLRGFRLTSVGRTLWDLSSLVPEKRFRRAFLEADRMGLIQETEVAKRLPFTRGHRGGAAYSRMVRHRLPHVDRTRSVLEALFLDLSRSRNWPSPRINAVEVGLEVDFSWREAKLIVELDGYEFHQGRESFERDAERNNRLRAGGWTVLRFTWRMIVDSPDRVVAQVEGILNQSSKRPA